jgi:hypothetical protein
MSQIDPWEKAAQCVKALEMSSEPELRTLLEVIRDSWIGLANRRSLLTGAEFARQATRLGRMHADLVQLAR